MLVVWECERLCVVFQLSTRQGFPQNIPAGVPVLRRVIGSGDFVDSVVPGYQTGTLKATGLSYSKPCTESPYKRIRAASVVPVVATQASKKIFRGPLGGQGMCVCSDTSTGWCPFSGKVNSMWGCLQVDDSLFVFTLGAYYFVAYYSMLCEKVSMPTTCWLE